MRLNSLWAPDPSTFSVIYPLDEILRRANLKVTIWDRDFPLAHTGSGFFQSTVKKLIQAKKWKDMGIKRVRVFYDPIYYARNSSTVQLLDPLHTSYVIKYEGLKT